MVGKLVNMLADGHILVQRYGDILDGKRTWEKELELSNSKMDYYEDLDENLENLYKEFEKNSLSKVVSTKWL
jgi:uncharacterized FAD-dependent dehydrogenase